MLEKNKKFDFFSGYDSCFLKNVFVKSFCATCIVWSFMIMHFWWGNHEWGSIKNLVRIQDGFFEARYSQHLFSVILLDGRILPVLVMFLALICLVMTAGMVAVYLKLPSKKSIFYIFILFVSLNPYLFILFYYLYLALPFMSWPLIGVCGLFLCEERRTWKKFLFCAFLWFLVLGSYPPNVAFLLTAFSARRIIGYCFENENFKEIIRKYVYLGGQFFLGFIGFKSVYGVLERNHILNASVYNIQMRKIEEMFFSIPEEFIKSIGQMFDAQTFLGWDYCILLFLPFVLAIYLLYCRCGKNRVVLSLLIIGVLLSSRFAFFVAENSKDGFVRMEYFGRLGIGVFVLAILGHIRNRCVQNLYLLWGIATLSLFIRSDFDIQKSQLLAFQAGRKFQARLVDKIVLHPKFEMKEKYITYSFGYPNFRKRFIDDKCKTGEMVEYIMVFYHEIVKGVFWEENINPDAIGAAIIRGRSLFWADHTQGGAYWLDKDYWKNNPENMNNIRYWLYMEARPNSVYVDDKYIILVPDPFDFYRDRELIAAKLDK